jgi:hypothetical protein
MSAEVRTKEVKFRGVVYVVTEPTWLQMLDFTSLADGGNAFENKTRFVLRTLTTLKSGEPAFPPEKDIEKVPATLVMKLVGAANDLEEEEVEEAKKE